MSVSKGFMLEEPPIHVSWGIGQADLRILFEQSGASAALRLVREGYYVARCTVLGGLGTQVGFHFRPQAANGVLSELELFDNGERQLEASYERYQRQLESAFGRPSRTQRGSVSAALPWHEWRKGRVHVSHYVMDRFGPEEHVRIVKRGWLASLLA